MSRRVRMGRVRGGGGRRRRKWADDPSTSDGRHAEGAGPFVAAARPSKVRRAGRTTSPAAPIVS